MPTKPQDQMIRGGRQLTDLLKASITRIERSIHTAQAKTRTNPGLAEDELASAANELLDLRDRIIEELEPMLQRRAAAQEHAEREASIDQLLARFDTMEQRLAETERRLAAFTHAPEATHV